MGKMLRADYRLIADFRPPGGWRDIAALSDKTKPRKSKVATDRVNLCLDHLSLESDSTWNKLCVQQLEIRSIGCLSLLAKRTAQEHSAK